VSERSQKSSADTIGTLVMELPNIEAAAKLCWKDVCAEMETIKGSMGQVTKQLETDADSAFAASMKPFHETASAQLTKKLEERDHVTSTWLDLLGWLGEEKKLQPEELFGSLHNFVLMLEKAHKYNMDYDENLVKKARMEEERARQQAKNASKIAAATQIGEKGEGGHDSSEPIWAREKGPKGGARTPLLAAVGEGGTMFPWQRTRVASSERPSNGRRSSNEEAESPNRRASRFSFLKKTRAPAHGSNKSLQSLATVGESAPPGPSFFFKNRAPARVNSSGELVNSSGETALERQPLANGAGGSSLDSELAAKLNRRAGLAE